MNPGQILLCIDCFHMRFGSWTIWEAFSQAPTPGVTILFFTQIDWDFYLPSCLQTTTLSSWSPPSDKKIEAAEKSSFTFCRWTKTLLIVRDKETGCKGLDVDIGKCFPFRCISFHLRTGNTDWELIHLNFFCKVWSLTCVGLRLSQQRRETQALWCTTAINASEEARTIWRCQSQTSKHPYSNPVTSQLYELHLLSPYNKLLKFHLNVFVCFITLQRSSKSLLSCRSINPCPSLSITL